MHFLFGCTAFQPSNSTTPPTDREGISRIARRSHDRGAEGTGGVQLVTRGLSRDLVKIYCLERQCYEIDSLEMNP